MSIDPAFSEYLLSVALTENEDGNPLEGDEIFNNVKSLPGLGG